MRRKGNSAGSLVGGSWSGIICIQSIVDARNTAGDGLYVSCDSHFDSS